MPLDDAEMRSVERDVRAGLPDRLRILLWVLLAANAAFFVANAVFDPNGLTRWVLFNGPVCLLIIFLLSRLRHAGSLARAIAFGVVLVGTVSGSTAAWGVLAGDITAATLITTAVCLCTSLALPWGPAVQLVVVVFGLTAMVSNALLVPGALASVGVTSVTAAVLPLVASIWIAQAQIRVASRTLAREREGQRVQRVLEKQLRFRALVQHSADLHVILDRELNVLVVEGNVEETLGYSSPSEFLGTLGPSYVHPEDVDKLPALFSEVVHGKGVVGPVEVRVRHADGSWVHIEFVARNLLDDPVIGGIVLNSRDVTLRRRVELDRELLLEVARELSATLDRDAMVSRVQQRMCVALPCERVITFFQDDGRRGLRLIGHHGFTQDEAARMVPLELSSDTPLNRALLGGKTIVTDGTGIESLLPPTVRPALANGFLLLVPLNIGGRLRGGLGFLREQGGRPFSPGQIQLAEGVGRHVSLAIGAAELYREQQETARISAALARVGREMISSLDTPVLLSRLCQLTTEALGCDASHTLLWEPDAEAYGVVAGYGDTPENWESLRLVRFPPCSIEGLLGALEQDKVVQLTGPWDTQPDPLSRLPEMLGITVALHVGLRRGDRLIGYQTALYLGRRERFTAAQERLARGIAHLGSLALENARLVEELEKADRLKSDFVANMSHELRSPLHVIIGYHEMLLEGALGPIAPQQVEALRRADRGARELLELVEMTLDLSRLTARRAPVDLEDVSIPKLVEDLIRADLLLAKPHLDLQCKVAPELPTLQTDRLKLRLILKNLLGNAVKFTDAGTVELSVRRRENGAEFEVADTGIGIPPAVRERIFEPFFQADGSASGRGGAGLGLYIVRRMVELLGGELEFDSEPGRGTTVRVWIPRHPTAAGPSPEGEEAT